MIEQIVQPKQLPNEIKPAFKELKVLQHLKTARGYPSPSSLYAIVHPGR